jgi:hypothetical protein
MHPVRTSRRPLGIPPGEQYVAGITDDMDDPGLGKGALELRKVVNQPRILLANDGCLLPVAIQREQLAVRLTKVKGTPAVQKGGKGLICRDFGPQVFVIVE